MKIAVGSTNPAKIKAARVAFQKVWPKKKFKIVGVDVKSGVSNQPMSDTESIKGARNRAKLSMEKTGADFGVGIEGGIHKVVGKYFDSGWVVVVNKKGEEGVGSSLRMETPPKAVKLVLEKGMELGHIDDLLFKTKNSKTGLGHFGLMTDGVLNRSDAYVQGVISALSRFIRPELF